MGRVWPGGQGGGIMGTEQKAFSGERRLLRAGNGQLWPKAGRRRCQEVSGAWAARPQEDILLLGPWLRWWLFIEHLLCAKPEGRAVDQTMPTLGLGAKKLWTESNY